MKKLTIMNNIQQTFGRVGFQLKKHSPEILVAAGVVGAVTSAVMACKATTKATKVLEQTKEDVAKIHDCLADESLADQYTEEDGKKDLTLVYSQTGIKLVKLYAPAVILGALSLTSIVASNNILRKRNVALAAAYATVDKSFKEYRGRVVERFGEEVDRQLKYNIKAKEVEETVVDENGKEKKVKKTINVVGSETLNCSEFARFFDADNPNWEKNAEYNLLFLRAQQQYANDLLRSKGYLFLNDVYDLLDIPRSKAGQSVGWIYDPDNGKSDSYVDFSILDLHKTDARDFSDDIYERTILLDFNVDGNIMNRVELEDI